MKLYQCVTQSARTGSTSTAPTLYLTEQDAIQAEIKLAGMVYRDTSGGFKLLTPLEEGDRGWEARISCGGSERLLWACEAVLSDALIRELALEASRGMLERLRGGE